MSVEQAATVDPQTAPPGKERRWPGVILSLFVPGFGLVRAGQPLRGLFSFVGIQFASVAVLLLMISRSIPTWAVCAGIVVSLFCFILVLIDSFRPGRLTWPMTILFVVVLAALIALPSLGNLVAVAYRVPTENMKPTVEPGDCLMADRVSYRFSKPKRGDLVVFRTTGLLSIANAGDKTLFLERVVGLPGEQIEINGGRVYANGKLLGQRDGIPPITYTAPMFKAPTESSSFTVPEESYFVLGDNSPHSYDSRYWGSVPQKNILGRAVRTYYPVSRIGTPK